MLILRTSAGSPFGRKIRIAVAVIGLNDQVEVVNANTSDENDSLRTQNPLGKIPILVQPNGESIYGSPVILDHLNELDGRGILIPPGAARTPALTQAALADGILDAALLQVYEGRFRPETHQWPKWLEYQQSKVDRAMAHAEAKLSTPGTGLPHVGEITQAAALGYLDFRFKGVWRQRYPKLVAWLADFERRVPSFKDTTPPG